MLVAVQVTASARLEWTAGQGSKTQSNQTAAPKRFTQLTRSHRVAADAGSSGNRVDVAVRSFLPEACPESWEYSHIPVGVLLDGATHAVCYLLDNAFVDAALVAWQCRGLTAAC